MQALGRMTSLVGLVLCVRRRGDGLPLPALRHLSTLARLERLELDLGCSQGELPPDLLPALGNMTDLDLALGSDQTVAWQRPDGSGPALRQLRLDSCWFGLPPDRLLHALRQLERLELYYVDLEEAQLSVLAQLPHLTSLVIIHDWAPWPAVLRCAGLRELDTTIVGNPPPAQPPPGSLLQLTRLVLDCAHASPAWLALPQLRSLVLTTMW